MIGIQKSLLLFILLLSLPACSQKPVVTSDAPATLTPFPQPVELTSTPLPLPTFTLTAVATMPPDVSPTFTRMPVMEMPSDFSPILYGEKYDANTFFILLGGWQGDRWLAPDLAMAYFGSLQDWEYDVYTLAKGKFQVHGDRPQFSPAEKLYTLGTTATLDEFGMVGVAHGWHVLQREVQELSSESEVYRQVVIDWLTAQGIAAPEPGALHIFRVDLEGDGVDEIFISATRLESQHAAQSGDYSIVLLRKVQGNEAVTRLVVGDVYQSQETTLPQTYSLGNFIDLNQDGVLEVVVDVQRWERDGALIYQIDRQNITQVP